MAGSAIHRKPSFKLRPRRAGAAGQAQLGFATAPPVLRYIQPRQAARARRDEYEAHRGMTDVPAIAEPPPGYEGSGRAGVGAPRGTAAETIGALEHQCHHRRSCDEGALRRAARSLRDDASRSTRRANWPEVIGLASIKAGCIYSESPRDSVVIPPLRVTTRPNPTTMCTARRYCAKLA